MLKDIRKTFKTEHKSVYHPSTHLILKPEWYRHTFTNNLYKSVQDYPSVVSLLNGFINKSEVELQTFLRKEICKLVKLLSDQDFNRLLIDFNASQKSKIKTRDGVCKQIKNSTSDFGELELNFVCKVLNVDLVFLDDTSNHLKVRNLTDHDNIQDNILFIYNLNNDLFSPISFKTGQYTNTIHTRKRLERDLDNFLDKHNYFLTLIKSIFEMKSRVNLKVLYESIKNALGIENLTDADKVLIDKLTGVLLDTRAFVES